MLPAESRPDPFIHPGAGSMYRPGNAQLTDSQSAELRKLFLEQMGAPLRFDLPALRLPRDSGGATDTTLEQAAIQHLRTFRDLFTSDEPPLELLRMSKTLFKTVVLSRPNESAEARVAYAFYLLSIAAAGKQLRKITTLTPAQVSRGLQWLAAQPWIDQATLRLQAQMASRLG